MRRYLLLCALLAGAFVLSGCEKKDEGPFTRYFFSDYLIVRYVEGDLKLAEEYSPGYTQDAPVTFYACWDVTEQYISPDLSDPEKSDSPYPAENTEGFLALAARNGDEPAERKNVGISISTIYRDFSVLADDFVSVSLTCNEAWDEAHPAGSSLNDLVRIELSSAWPLLHSGESGSDRVTDPDAGAFSCRLSELPAEALRTVFLWKYFENHSRSENLCMRLTFEEAVPFSVEFMQPRRLTLTLTTADGRTKSASLDLVDPSQRDKRF